MGGVIWCFEEIFFLSVTFHLHSDHSFKMLRVHHQTLHKFRDEELYYLLQDILHMKKDVLLQIFIWTSFSLLD